MIYTLKLQLKNCKQKIIHYWDLYISILKYSTLYFFLSFIFQFKVVNCIAGVGTRSVKLLLVIEKQAVVYMIIATISSKFLKDEHERSEVYHI